MSRVERCYRGLIRLLPSEERAARGEEFLGLLLDLEEHRHWPSVREIVALIALAARLHIRRLGMGRLCLGLLGAYLMVVGTSALSQMVAAAVSAGDGSALAGFDPGQAAFALADLVVAVGWIMGAYRLSFVMVTLLAIHDIQALRVHFVPGAGFGFFIETLGGVPGLVWAVATCVGLPAVLGIATRHRPARTEPRIGFAGLAIAFAVQTAYFLGRQPALVSGAADLVHRYAAWMLCAACAGTVAVATRRQARRVRLTAVVAGLAGGWILSLAMPHLIAVTVAAIVCAREVARAVTALRARSRRSAPHYV